MNPSNPVTVCLVGWLVGWVTSEPQQSCLSLVHWSHPLSFPSPALELQAHMIESGISLLPFFFNVGAGDLNSGLLVCTASFLTTH